MTIDIEAIRARHQALADRQSDRKQPFAGQACQDRAALLTALDEARVTIWNEAIEAAVKAIDGLDLDGGNRHYALLKAANAVEALKRTQP